MSETRIVPARAIPEDIVETLRQEGSFPPGLGSYPSRLERLFRTSRMANGLSRLATVVEPVDRALGVDEAMPAARAFRVGAFLGLRVVSACVDSVDAAFAEMALIPSIAEAAGDDDLHMRHLFATGIVDLGREAYAKVDEMFDPLFDEWEDVLEPSVPYQPYLRSGFGIPVAYLHARYAANDEARRQADMMAMAKAAEGRTDWDAEFQSLLS